MAGQENRFSTPLAESMFRRGESSVEAIRPPDCRPVCSGNRTREIDTVTAAEPLEEADSFESPPKGSQDNQS